MRNIQNDMQTKITKDSKSEEPDTAALENKEALKNSSSFRYHLSQRKGLFIAAAVAVIILLLPTPAAVTLGNEVIILSEAGKSMIVLLVVFVIIFATEALPTGLTVAFVYAWVVFSGILSPRDAGQVFSHEAAWFLVGALMIAQVIIKHNLHKRLLGIIFKISGSKSRNLIYGIVATSALLAAFIADHIVVAMLLPVGIAISGMLGGYKKVPQFTKALMFSIAFGATIGGLGTPSGGGRNVVMIGFLDQFFGVEISYGAWAVMAFPIVIILIPIIGFTILKFFKPEVDDISEVFDEVQKEIKLKKMGLKEWLVLGVFGIVLFLWIFKSSLGIGMVALFGTLLFYVLGLASWKDYEDINWGIPLLYFGAIGMGSALIKSGAALWLGAKAFSTLTNLGITSSTVFIGFQSVFMGLYTQVMGDGAAVASMGPIMLESTRFSGADPIITGISMAIASSFAFMLIIGTPANAIVFGSGFLKVKEFLKIGSVLTVISLFVLVVVTKFYWIDILGVGIDGFH